MLGKRGRKGDSVLGIKKFFKLVETSSPSSGRLRENSEESFISTTTELARDTESMCSRTRMCLRMSLSAAKHFSL